MNGVIRDYNLNKISAKEYELSVSQLLEAIGKVTNVIYNYSAK